MVIDDLIAQLEKIREERGPAIVAISGYDSDFYNVLIDVENKTLEFNEDGKIIHHPCVVLRPGSDKCIHMSFKE